MSVTIPAYTSVIYRDPATHLAPNASGYFVRNRHGATVAGPYATRFEAWAEQDRREPGERMAARTSHLSVEGRGA